MYVYVHKYLFRGKYFGSKLQIVIKLLSLTFAIDA